MKQFAVMFMSFLVAIAIAAQTPQSTAESNVQVLYSVSVDRSVNLRAGPGTSYAIVLVAEPGDSFDVVGRQKGNPYNWLEILFESKTVWIAESLTHRLPDPTATHTATISPTASITPSSTPTHTPTATSTPDTRPTCTPELAVMQFQNSGWEELYVEVLNFIVEAVNIFENWRNDYNEWLRTNRWWLSKEKPGKFDLKPLPMLYNYRDYFIDERFRDFQDEYDFMMVDAIQVLSRSVCREIDESLIAAEELLAAIQVFGFPREGSRDQRISTSISRSINEVQSKINRSHMSIDVINDLIATWERQKKLERAAN